MTKRAAGQPAKSGPEEAQNNLKQGRSSPTLHPAKSDPEEAQNNLKQGRPSPTLQPAKSGPEEARNYLKQGRSSPTLQPAKSGPEEAQSNEQVGRSGPVPYHVPMESPTLHRPTHAKAPRLAWWLATGFGSGYLRPAPGTWGSLAGLLAWLLLAHSLRRVHASAAPWLMLAAPLLLTLIAVWVSDLVVKETGLKDPSCIVIDEWAGMWFALTPMLFTVAPQPLTLWILRLLVPFLLFRLFDIWKPGPVDAAQSLPGGWGVVLDDVLAGLLAGLFTLPLDRWLGAQALAHPSLWRS